MTTNNTNPNRPTQKDLDNKAMQGIDKHIPKNASLTLLGSAFTPEALKAVFQAEIDATNAAESARVQWMKVVADQRAIRTRTRPVRQALKQYLLSTYAGTDAVGVLQDFGFGVPRGAGKRTVAVKAQAVAKAAATRTARHTLGPKARKLIKGAVASPAPGDASPSLVAASSAGSSPAGGMGPPASMGAATPTVTSNASQGAGQALTAASAAQPAASAATASGAAQNRGVPG
jgi:hypothetical protein